ncbi:response regulator [Uliginosibacterium sp. sgz301328]|uniref:response regulator n=1 Tax=Uliginosibacterium sp. sgz301328 TaxID=3243764 RepID=UPI00359E7126
MIRIIVADDHPVVRAGIVAVLKSAPDISVIGEADGVGALTALVAADPPDMIVTDYQMPDTDGNDGARMLRFLRQRYPRVPVIVLTMLTNPLVYRLILKLDARGLLVKSGETTQLLEAVRVVRAGRRYISPAISAALEERSDAQLNADLSLRETEVIRLFAGGLTVNDIARQLERSKKTISHQKRSAMEKIGAQSDQELIEFVIRSGLV